jgi:predicted  nucleic acid-binding Zn-ribbon protein
MNKKQRKQIEKKIEGFKKQIEKHEEKIKTMTGKKDTTHDYWKKEIARMEEEKRELEEKRNG